MEHFKSKQLNKAISFALMKLGFLDKAFKEGEHPRDDGGVSLLIKAVVIKIQKIN